MNAHPPPHATSVARRQDGFILITSLIFLVVLTLLAVSAINSSTLQERMAANQREKSRALDAADSALRYVETRLASKGFRDCNPLVGPNASNSGSCDDDATGLTVTAASSAANAPVVNYFSDTFWSQTGVSIYQLPGTPSTSGLKVQYFVEYLGQTADDLSPGSAGQTSLFRITARARGRSPAARAVVQSVYQVSI